MIVKNEQDNLGRCLESVKEIVDEMIIVDTGSTDSTVQIAEKFGAKVYHFKWNNNFSDARNYSLKFATSDWILLMDADDELDTSHNDEIRALMEKDEAEAYFFKTISYIGERPGLDTLNNLNLRLFKNKKGYCFSNPIHEQIYSNIKAINPSAKILNVDIKIYHYGYLNKNITAQNKRNRNISILEKELAENPGYGFALFNLGNEYFALGNFLKAIECYEQSYDKFDPNQGYSSKLVLKMINCYMSMSKYDKALKLVSEGLLVYPDFTELEYFRALIYYTQKKYTLAIRHFENCIKMGESSLYFTMIEGVGSYRTHFMLGEIFYYMEDYETALNHYKKSVETNSEFTPSIIKSIMSLCKRGLDNKSLQVSIDELKPYDKKLSYLLIFEILIQEKYYELTLDYIKKLEKKQGPSSGIIYYKGLCKLMLKKYKNSFTIMNSIKCDPEYGTRALSIQIFTKILEKDFLQVSKIFDTLKPNEDKLIKVYQSLSHLLEKNESLLLSDNENDSRDYSVIIFDLLRILIDLNEFTIFERALALLNSINDKTVLLKLAKLYYSKGCFSLAYQEFMRSIKTFDLLDTEGAEMLHKLKTYGY
jgi:glycosyltransferase involved in cell wall biosynthesis